MATRSIVAACADLLFTARVRAAAEAVGVRAVFLSARVDPLEQVREAEPALVLLDLEARWLDAPGLIRALKTEPLARDIQVIAFASHVHADAIAGARAAGADRVLARSAFVQQLPVLLGGVRERST